MMKISRTYYIRNPKNLGKADAEFQASWGLKRKDDDIKYIRADQIKALVEALEFYADPETYFGIFIMGDPPCGTFIEDFSETDLGGKPGKLARHALAILKAED